MDVRGKVGLTKPPNGKSHLQPYDMATPKAKTLYELAEEREAELLRKADARRRVIQGGKPKAHEAGITVEKRSGAATAVQDEEEALGPLSLSFFYALTLSMLHFTLDVLVYHQYRREIEWPAIFRRTVTSLPGTICPA